MKILINLLFQPFSQDILMPRPFLGYPHSRRIRGFGYRNYYSSGSSYSNGKKEWFFEFGYFTFWMLVTLTLLHFLSATSIANIDVEVLTCMLMILNHWKLFNSKLASMLSLGIRVGHDQDPKNTNSSNQILASAKPNIMIWFWPFCSSKSHSS